MEDYADSITAERVKHVIDGYKSKSSVKKEIFSQKLTIANLKRGKDLYEEAIHTTQNHFNHFDKISKPIISENCIKVFGTYMADSIMQGTGGDFSFYELGESILIDKENLNENVPTERIREYIWYMETRDTLPSVVNNVDNTYFLGSQHQTDYYFYYEKGKPTTLNHAFLTTIKTKAENYIIYADKNSLSDVELMKYHIVFKKIPRDIARL